MVIPLEPTATELLHQLVNRYAHYRKKAVQRGQITPHDAAALMVAYGEGIEHAMRAFLQEDKFQPHAEVDRIKAQVIQAVIDLDPHDVLNHRLYSGTKPHDGEEKPWT